MNHIMIDLETMSTQPNAAIVAIGACFFDPATAQVGAQFEAFVDLATSATICHMDPDTVLFWMKQSDEARQKLLTPEAIPLSDAILEFTDWACQIEGYKNRIVWGNGASFDNVILRNAFQMVGMQPCWPFFNDRDVRTMVALGRELLGFDPKRDMPFDGVQHNALDDAIHQAKYVSAIYRKLNTAKVN